MGEQVSVLLLAPDPRAVEQVRSILRGLEGFECEVGESDLQNGLRRLREEERDVAMVFLDGETRLGLAVIEEIGRLAPATQIFALSHEDSPELIIRAMRAGANEFLALPPDAGELLKALIKVTELRRYQQPAGPKGELWTVYSPKGGTGVTTVVACIGLEMQAQGKRTALVDFDFDSGDLPLCLNLNPAYTVLDIALNFKRLDSVFLQGTMTRHPSGLALLAAPPRLDEESAPFPPEQAAEVLDLLRGLYEFVVVDTARRLDSLALTALTSATRVLLLTEMTLPSLRGCLRTIERLGDEGVDPERIVVVASKCSGSAQEIPVAEAARTLRHPVRYVLPREDETALAILNKGLPPAEIRPWGPLRKAILTLTAQGQLGDGSPGHPRRRRWGLLRLIAPRAEV